MDTGTDKRISQSMVTLFSHIIDAGTADNNNNKRQSADITHHKVINKGHTPQNNPLINTGGTQS